MIHRMNFTFAFNQYHSILKATPMGIGWTVCSNRGFCDLAVFWIQRYWSWNQETRVITWWLKNKLPVVLPPLFYAVSSSNP